MAVWSEVNLKNTVFHQRIDSEFFQPENERLMNTLFQTKSVSNFGKFITVLTDGKHGGVTYTPAGVLFIRNRNIKNGFLDLNDNKYISKIESDESKRAELEPLDIVITTIGTLGESAIVPEDIPLSTINQNLVRIKLKDIDPYYISIFLLTAYGRRQVCRLATGNVQPIIVYPNLKKVFIYQASKEKQIEIRKIFEHSYRLKKHSKSLYTQAQQLLEHELGLDKLKFEKPVGYETSFSEVVNN
ncbi:MAG: restriction endonuclease subunit S, partial [Deltaproteobacteria bacterium]|nr:restriction endonuclease subunit S [Deltaproteobacteria bacterium]